MKKFLVMLTLGLMGIGAQAMAADCPIKVGGLAPLSAPGSVTGGEAMRAAMLIAERDINAAGGVRMWRMTAVFQWFLLRPGMTPSQVISRSTFFESHRSVLGHRV